MAKTSIEFDAREIRTLLIDHIRSKGNEVPSTAKFSFEANFDEELTATITYDMDGRDSGWEMR